MAKERNPVIFADISTVSAEHLKDFAIIGLSMISALTSMGLWGASKRSQKREVTFAEDFVTGKQCNLMHVEIDRRVTSLEQQIVDRFDQIQRDDHMRAAGIYERINRTERSFSDQIQALPSQLIAILKNTGAIK